MGSIINPTWKAVDEGHFYSYEITCGPLLKTRSLYFISSRFGILRKGHFQSLEAAVLGNRVEICTLTKLQGSELENYFIRLSH